VVLDDHEYLLSKHFILYCPSCKEALSGASCESCGRVYTWKLGTVDTFGKVTEAKKSPADEELQPQAEEGVP
jgi:methionyl-tRNA synthetase